jgi:hypothetical protein
MEGDESHPWERTTVLHLRDSSADEDEFRCCLRAVNEICADRWTILQNSTITMRRALSNCG